MRLDKFMTGAGAASRKETAAAVKKGRITVDGIPARKADMQIDPKVQHVSLDGVPVVYREFHYLMLHKPQGVVSATDAPGDTTVLDLLPENLQNLGLFPCGRLDKNTTGFVLLTNDGQLGHRLLSPRFHVEKDYRFSVKYPLSEEDCSLLASGVHLEADSTAAAWDTAPCRIRLDEDRLGGGITLTEGKYHEIKRMMEAVHNQITALARISFAGISLDPTLAAGAFRYLTPEEEALLYSAAETEHPQTQQSKP